MGDRPGRRFPACRSGVRFSADRADGDNPLLGPRSYPQPTLAMTDHDHLPAPPDSAMGITDPAGSHHAARLLEHRVARDPEFTRYLLLLDADAPLPAGAAEVTPKTLPLEPPHLGFALFHGFAAVIAVALWHLVNAFGGWETVPLLLLAMVAASFFVPPSAFYDGTQPGRVVRVRELSDDVKLPPLQRVGMWVQDRKVALAALAPGAWLVCGALENALPPAAGLAGTALLLLFTSRTILRRLVDEIAAIPAVQRAASAVAGAAVLVLGFAIMFGFQWWWFQNLVEALTLTGAMIAILLFRGLKVWEERRGEALTLGDMVPPGLRAPRLTRNQRLAAALAGITAFGVSLKIGEVADGIAWAGAVVLALVSVALVVLAMASGPDEFAEPLPKRRLFEGILPPPAPPAEEIAAAPAREPEPVR